VKYRAVYLFSADGAIHASASGLCRQQRLQTAGRVVRVPAQVLCTKPDLDNFSDLFTIMGKSWVPFSRYVFNTLLLRRPGTVGCVLFTSMGAYALTKGKFPGNQTIFKVIVVSLMFSGYVTAIPNYLVLAKLGWIDTYLSVIVPAFGMPMGLFLTKQYMESIPDSLLEAARIDGASEWKIFWRIAMPMARPAWVTVIIFSVQNLWNSRLHLIYSEDLKTLPYALQQILNGGVSRTGSRLRRYCHYDDRSDRTFIIAQRQVMETMASSGLKD
jgi:ABC-type glycerol-3-phosphate transport system permease component